MKIISEKPAPNAGPNGKRRVVVELDPGETLHAFRADSHYQLGNPLDDQVINGRILQDAESVCWDSMEQKWM